MKEWKPREWAEEQGQIKAGVGPFIDRMQRERNAWVYRREFPTRGDKAVRAQSIRGRMALDGLYVPQNAAWLSDFRSELLSFPAGKHDDIVDALGLIGQLLDYMSVGNKPQPNRKSRKSMAITSTNRLGPRMIGWSTKNVSLTFCGSPLSGVKRT